MKRGSVGVRVGVWAWMSVCPDVKLICGSCMGLVGQGQGVFSLPLAFLFLLSFGSASIGAYCSLHDF